MSHMDMLGSEVAVDDYVCGAYGSGHMGIFRVVRKTEKMLVLIHYKADTGFGIGRYREHHRYPNEVIRLSENHRKAVKVKIDEYEKELLVRTLEKR